MDRPPDQKSARGRALIDFARAQVCEATSARPAQAVRLPAPESFPGYRIVEVVNRGGQGVVYRAVQQSTGKGVALKVLRDGVLAERREIARFERETEILAQLNHPNIVGILDAGASNEGHFLVMDFIDGDPLDEYVRRHEPRLRQLLDLFAVICEAVNAAHLRGVIHRDLKPSNIRVDEHGMPFVLDFGAARHDWYAGSESIDVTVTGQFIGSLPWASPEQVTGESAQVDTRTDVYSLGVMLYQLLSGSFPYCVTGSFREVIDTIVHANPTSLRSMRPKLGDEIETIVLRCLNKDPDRRYQSAGELARDLRRYLDGQPIEAKRDSTWYVLKKTLRRHRVMALATFVTVSAFGMATIVSSYWAIQAQRASKRAERESAARARFTDFLRSVIRAASPTVAQGEDISVGEVLDRWAKELESAGLDAETETIALVELGSTYLALGRYADALIALDKAIVHLGLAVGGAHHDTLGAELLRIEALIGTGAFDLAVDNARRVSATAKRSLPSGDSLVLSTEFKLGVALTRARKLDEAHDVLQAVLAQQRATLGSGHLDVARCLDQLAQVANIREYGNAQAEVFTREALAIFQTQLGPSHPDTLDTQSGLGNLLSIQGKYEKAELLLREALELSRQVLGNNHWNLSRPLCFLGNVLLRTRPVDPETLTISQEAAFLARINAKQDPKFALQCFQLNGEVLWRLGRKEEASNAWGEGVKASRLHPDGFSEGGARQCLSNHAEALRSLGRCDEAIEAYLEATVVFDEFLGEDSEAALAVLWHCAATLRECERWEQQVPLLDEYVSRVRRCRFGTHLHAKFFFKIGQVHSDRGEADKAEEFLVEALRAADAAREVAKDEKENAQITSLRSSTIDALVTFYESRGRPEDAERIRALGD